MKPGKDGPNRKPPSDDGVATKHHSKHPSDDGAAAKHHSEHPSNDGAAMRLHSKHPSDDGAVTSHHRERPSDDGAATRLHSKHPSDDGAGARQHSKHPSDDGGDLTELVEPCGALPRKCYFYYLSLSLSGDIRRRWWKPAGWLCVEGLLVIVHLFATRRGRDGDEGTLRGLPA
jgi:hypothetical protein